MDFTDPPEGQRLHGAKCLPRVRRFQEHWKEQYPWVYYDVMLGKMFCKTCKDHADVCDPASAYFSGGCSNFQLMSLASHAKSKGHLSAEEVVRLQNYSTAFEWDEKSVMCSQASSSSSVVPVHLYRRPSEVTSPSREACAREMDVHNEAQQIESPGTSFSIGSNEDRIRLLRMAAEEAWRSVGPGSYNVPISLDFPHTFQDVKLPQSAENRRNSATIFNPFCTPVRVKPTPKVESVSPQSSDMPPGYPQVVQSPSASIPQRIKHLCLNAHAVAKNCMSYEDYKWMCELDMVKGVDVGETVSIKDCRNLQKCISETVFDEIAEAAKRSTFMSVFCDQLPSVTYQIVYMKTVHSGKPQIHVLSVQPLQEDPDSLTHSISSAFNQELTHLDVDWMERYVGLSCDSPVIKPQEDNAQKSDCDVRQAYDAYCEHDSSSEESDSDDDLDNFLTTKDQEGNAEKTDCVVKQEPDDYCKSDDSEGTDGDTLATFLRTKNPQITSLHCSAHMINLACRKAVRSDYHNQLEQLIACVCRLRYLCRNSSPRRDEEIRHVKCKSRIGKHRWISTTLHNVLCVIQNFSTIVSCFKEYERSQEERIKQRLKLLLTRRCVKYLHFLVDLLQVLSHVCHVMTQTTASIGEVYEAICDAADNLRKLKKRSGQQLAKVEKETEFHGHALSSDDMQEFEQDRDDVLTEMTSYMTSCVADLNESTMTAMTKLVCLSQWPSDPNQLKDYADEDVLLIVDQFSQTFHKHGVNTDKCLMEWSLLKNHIRRRFTHPSAASWETIYPACKHKCENVLSVLSFILTLPGQSIDRGRVYAYFDKLPAKWKKKLGADDIKNILRIFLHTPDVGEFDPCTAAALYCEQNQSSALYCDQNQSTKDQPIRKKVKIEKC